MNHFEEYIAEWYDTIPEGGGTAASPWKIEWNDVPYKERDTRPLSRLKVLGAMKEVLFNGTPTQRAAVYIHIPFCRLSCTYCSFFKKKGDNKAQHEYVELLLKELESLSDKPYVKKSKISAVFFGGGTPGILSAGDMADILCAIKKTFLLAEDAEVTMESSLSDMTEEKMDVAIAGGVTRFSFGIQSFNSQVRNTVGRPYSRKEVLKQLSIYSKKKADIIIDLIYGLPYETEETMRQDIRDAAACGIAGLDLYKLQLLPDSPLGKSFAAAGKCLIESEVRMGVPKQEKWLWNHRKELGPVLAMGVGGVFDVMAGNLQRAPLWMRNHRLEWAYRLYLQPSRIGRMAAIPKFMLAIKKWKRKNGNKIC